MFVEKLKVNDYYDFFKFYYESFGDKTKVIIIEKDDFELLNKNEKDVSNFAKYLDYDRIVFIKEGLKPNKLENKANMPLYSISVENIDLYKYAWTQKI